MSKSAFSFFLQCVFPPLQFSDITGIYGTLLACCVSNTRPFATAFCPAGEVCVWCFSRNVTAAQGEQDPAGAGSLGQTAGLAWRALRVSGFASKT